jgi:hypothetical protein
MPRFALPVFLAVVTGISMVCSTFGQQTQMQGQACVDCHKQVTPNIVSDWQLSKHSQNDVGCPSCHGNQHMSKDDVVKAELALPDKCNGCHEAQVEQFKSGKHALAWASMKAMPTLHWQPMSQVEGLKGCGACHRHGLKSEAEVKDLRDKNSAFGVASCDVCHTRHLFSLEEARSPQACQTCHMGIDHPQWEMYSSSKHGVRYLLRQNKVLPETVAAPTCQTCHMQEGDHEVRTSWGFLALRLPLPDDPQWESDRTIILKALGVLDPSGEPTARLDVVKQADMVRFTQEAWQEERDRMIGTCRKCHSVNFAKAELKKGDQMIRSADGLMAQGIQIVADLYKDNILAKPVSYPYAYPDLLTFHDAPTVIEQKLFKMFLEHRMRAFQGTFHANPEYSFWYGWSEMQQDLSEIKEMAAQMRREAARTPSASTQEKPVEKKKISGKK